MFIPALFTIAKIWKQPKYPLVDEWIKKRKKKKWYIYTMEYYAAVKKKKLTFFSTAWVDMGEIHAKWIKPVSERKIAHYLTYM